jgi:hypothetical protein
MPSKNHVPPVCQTVAGAQLDPANLDRGDQLDAEAVAGAQLDPVTPGRRPARKGYTWPAISSTPWRSAGAGLRLQP